MSAIVGIDLGTTHSLISVLQNGVPELIRNELGQVLTPSIVGIDESGTILVGSQAKELQVIHPERCVGVFKRHMGNEKWSAEIGGKRMSAVELSSCVLRALKADAESSLKREVTRAVITVPAYFNEDQRRATILAGQLAGLQVERILNEPTAAAIACGFSNKDEDRIAVVVDLGGGTFDVSIVELFEGTLEIRASAGDIFLGGEDFTNALMALVLQQLGMQFERVEMQQPLLISRLRRESEVAKRKLSSEASAEVRVPDAQGHFGENPQKVIVTRDQFDAATKKLVDRLLLPLRQALGDAKLNRTQIQDVILVGGATRMPCVQQKIRELFEKTPQFQLNPDEVVALGAGIHAGVVGRDDAVRELIITDVSPFTMGIEVSQEVAGDYREGFYLPIINRNTVVPVSRVKQVTTLHPNQTILEVKVYQGEARKVADNTLLGKFTVKGIPPGPAGQAVDVRFTYDLNGVLEVEATIVETQRKATHVLQRRSGNLTAAQLSDAVKRMQAFKVHPRENADNRHLIQRAERLYAELSIQHRDMLDELLQGFESVLEENNKQAIEKYRTILQEFLDRFDNDWGNHGELGFNSDDTL